VRKSQGPDFSAGCCNFELRGFFEYFWLGVFMKQSSPSSCSLLAFTFILVFNIQKEGGSSKWCNNDDDGISFFLKFNLI